MHQRREMPKRTPQDIGTVALSPDRLTITFSPGPDPNGIIWVRLDDTDTSGTALGGASELPA